MTDIAERLRKLDEVVTFDGPWLREAAAEIDRLRKALVEESAVARETDDALAKTDAYRDKLIAENERLRGIIYRNCDASKAAILSSDEDAAVIRKICDADEDPCR